MILDGVNIDFTFIRTNGITLHVAQAGPASGPPVILLHGFPEFWYGWRNQVAFLAQQGYRVWMPDQRGYNLSDKPAGIPAYNLNELANDIIGLIDATGSDRVYLAGHDWGAAVAWWVALHYPERLYKLCIMNVPHPAAFRDALRKYPQQWLKSWYAISFQMPMLPEFQMTFADGELLLRVLKSTSRKGAFADRDAEFYRQAWLKPGAMRSMINWYRAAVQQPLHIPADARCTVPTLIIWGARDPFLGQYLAQMSAAQCDAVRLELIREATHWVQHEEAPRVNALLAAHFAPA